MSCDRFVFANKFFMKKDHYRQSLVPSHEVYLSYGLSACYETSRLVGNMQRWRGKCFHDNSQLFLMYVLILEKTCNFWLTFQTIFKTWFSNVNLWSISITNSSYLLLLSWLSPTLIYWILPDVVRRCGFPLLAFK